MSDVCLIGFCAKDSQNSIEIDTRMQALWVILLQEAVLSTLASKHHT